MLYRHILILNLILATYFTIKGTILFICSFTQKVSPMMPKDTKDMHPEHTRDEDRTHKEKGPTMAEDEITTSNLIEKKKNKIDVRLPRNINPLSYHVKLQPFVNGNFSIHGHVEMTFEVLEDTYNVTVHINDIVTKNETIKVIIRFANQLDTYDVFPLQSVSKAFCLLITYIMASNFQSKRRNRSKSSLNVLFMRIEMPLDERENVLGAFEHG